MQQLSSSNSSSSSSASSNCPVASTAAADSIDPEDDDHRHRRPCAATSILGLARTPSRASTTEPGTGTDIAILAAAANAVGEAYNRVATAGIVAHVPPPSSSTSMEARP
ncbi:hypothetical protein NW754_002094 [Fusarium falciforme]|nr:hypothetical protein NW754_002094 [Fusarium falciforme]